MGDIEGPIECIRNFFSRGSGNNFSNIASSSENVKLNPEYADGKYFESANEQR